MKKKILVVDDYPIILKYMKRLLEKNGHEVITTTDGLSAIVILEAFIPDVVFIDLVMPNIDGKKLCCVIREMPHIRDACIVILSAIAAEEDFDFAAIGANACIAKGPFDSMSKHILDVIDQSDHLRQKTDATQVLGLENIYKRKITTELLAVKKHFESVLGHMAEGILELSPAGKIIMANPAATEIIEAGEEKLLGIAFADVFDKVDQKEIESYIESANAKRPTDLVNFTVGLNKRKLSLAILPVADEEDWSFVVILQDITEAQQARNALREAHAKLERRVRQRTVELVTSNNKLKIEIEERVKAEAALRESEEKYRELIENINEVIYSVDEKGVINYISPVVTAIFGYETKEILGRHFSAFFPDEEKARVAKDFEKIATGKLLTKEYRVLTQSGDIRWVRFSNRPVYKGDRLFGVSGAITDVTKSKHLEVQLQQAQKMEAIGTLAGGIAHDFNNLLMGIQGHSSLMKGDINPSYPHFQHLKAIEEYVDSASGLTRQLLDFARGGKYAVGSTDLNDLVKRSSQMFGRTQKEIKIKRKYQKKIWPVEVDQGQIEQVLLNLYVNAWQAMPGGGELFLETKNRPIDEIPSQPFPLPGGKYVEISVTDTGVGMDEETCKRIFDPFFTTKERGDGTGLGLASAYGIIKNHEGYIYAMSKIGEGTTFHIYLPAVQSMADSKPIEESSEIALGHGTILLVDDEDVIVHVGEAMLKKLGYHTIIARSGSAVLEAYKADMDQIKLVILDIVMPDISGGDVYDQLKAINPEIKVLLSSGYGIDGEASEILSRGCNRFIQKPFTLEKLSQEIRKIMNTE